MAALLRGIVAALGAILPWALELLRKLPGIKFPIVLAIVVAVIAAIPWPSWFTGIGGLFAGLPAGVLWGLDLLMLEEGLAIIASAWGLRFLLRWIRAAVSAV